jgi:hypothetical protein
MVIGPRRGLTTERSTLKIFRLRRADYLLKNTSASCTFWEPDPTLRGILAGSVDFSLYRPPHRIRTYRAETYGGVDHVCGPDTRCTTTSYQKAHTGTSVNRDTILYPSCHQLRLKLLVAL